MREAIEEIDDLAAFFIPAPCDGDCFASLAMTLQILSLREPPDVRSAGAPGGRSNPGLGSIMAETHFAWLSSAASDDRSRQQRPWQRHLSYDGRATSDLRRQKTAKVR